MRKRIQLNERSQHDVVRQLSVVKAVNVSGTGPDWIITGRVTDNEGKMRAYRGTISVARGGGALIIEINVPFQFRNDLENQFKQFQ